MVVRLDEHLRQGRQTPRHLGEVGVRPVAARAVGANRRVHLRVEVPATFRVVLVLFDLTAAAVAHRVRDAAVRARVRGERGIGNAEGFQKRRSFVDVRARGDERGDIRKRAEGRVGVLSCRDAVVLADVLGGLDGVRTRIALEVTCVAARRLRRQILGDAHVRPPEPRRYGRVVHPARVFVQVKGEIQSAVLLQAHLGGVVPNARRFDPEHDLRRVQVRLHRRHHARLGPPRVQLQLRELRTRPLHHARLRPRVPRGDLQTHPRRASDQIHIRRLKLRAPGLVRRRRGRASVAQRVATAGEVQLIRQSPVVRVSEDVAQKLSRRAEKRELALFRVVPREAVREVQVPAAPVPLQTGVSAVAVVVARAARRRVAVRLGA